MNDPNFRARRQQIADLSIEWLPGDPIPRIAYTDEENRTWAQVSATLRLAHHAHAADAYLDGAASLDLPDDRVPQLADVCRRLDSLSGFRLRPVPGVVPRRTFFGGLADLTFMSTQYVRHPSTPMYSPEPDIIRQLAGHINLIANPIFAELHYLAGRASRRCTTDSSLDFFNRVFWFTLEFGVVLEDGDFKAYGAGLTSSVSEMEQMRNAEIRPFDIAEMGTFDFDPYQHQPILFSVPSIDWMRRELGRFFDSYGTEAYEDHWSPRLTTSA